MSRRRQQEPQESPWGTVAGAVWDGLSRATEPQRKVVDQVVQFATHFQRSAMPWLLRLSAEPCCVEACRAQSVTHCQICKSRVCLGHAFVNSRAEVVCELCVQEVLEARASAAESEGPRRSRSRQQQGPSAAQVQWALEALGLKRTATWADIKRAHRKIVAENHPDRPAKSERLRERRERTTVKANQAYTILDQANFGRQAA